MTTRGKLITIDGLDGSGKTTFTSVILNQLQAAGKTVVSTREPGGTVLGENLRELLLHQKMHLETEALLMFASRREHIAQVITPALDRGDWVLSDRFTDASFAYQGGGRGLDLSKLETLEQWVHPDLQPDLTLLFDVPLEIARKRMDTGRCLDKFERERDDFFHRCRNEYLRRAAECPTRVIVIDSSKTLEQTGIAVCAALKRIL
jgi:dTMP kinase